MRPLLPRILAAVVAVLAVAAIAGPGTAAASSIGNLSAVTLSTTAANATGVTWSFSFTASGSGGMNGSGSINVATSGGTLPTELVIDDTTQNETIYGFSSGDTAAASQSYSFDYSQDVVDPGDHLEASLAGATNPGIGSGYQLSVSTSADTTAAQSPDFATTTPQSISAPSAVSLSTTAAGATEVSWSFSFKVSSTGGLQQDGSINIATSGGTLPTSIEVDDTTSSQTFYGYAASDTPAASESYTGLADSADSNDNVNAGDTLDVILYTATNPAVGSGYHLSVSTSSDPTTAQTPGFSTTTPQSIGSLSAVSLSTTAADATAVTWSFSFKASSTGGLDPYGAINIEASGGTLPTEIEVVDVTQSTEFPMFASGNPGGTESYAGVGFSSGDEIQPGDTVDVSVPGVTNPAVGSDYTLSVATSSDTQVAQTAAFATTTPTSVGNLSAVTLSSRAGDASGVSWSFSFVASQTGALSETSLLNVSTSAGTLPVTAQIDDVTQNQTFDVVASGNAGSSESYTDFAYNINAGDTVDVTLQGATNPDAGTSAALTVSTSSDTVAAQTPSFSTTSGGSLSGLTAPTLSSTAAGATGVSYGFSMKTSNSGALAADTGSITVQAPAGSVLPSCLGFSDQTNGNSSDGCSSTEVTGDRATYVVVEAIGGGDTVGVTLDGVTNPAVGTGYQLEVSTSSDTGPEPTPVFATTTPQAIGSLSAVTLSTSAAGATGVTWAFSFTVSSTGQLGDDGAIDVTTSGGTLPTEAEVDDVTQDESYLVDASSNPGSSESYTGLEAVKAGDTLDVTLEGATNPAAGTDTTLTVSTSSDTAQQTPSFSTTSPGSISHLSAVTLSSTAADATGVSYSFSLQTSSTGALAANNGTITIEAPAGTVLPSCVTVADQTSSHTANACASNAGATGIYQVDADIGDDDTLAVTLDDVENPAQASGDTLTVFTSSDASPVKTPPYTITAPLTPVVSSVSPTGGPVAGGTAVTITGEYLAGATAVSFGSAAAQFKVDSPTQITATAPPDAGPGTVAVTVATPYGTSAKSSTDQYAYALRPTVMNISPAAGPLAGGTAVTITGTNLSGASAVDFGGRTASFSVSSANSIEGVAPSGVSVSSTNVTVVTPGGTSATSAADVFTYLSTAQGTASVSGKVTLKGSGPAGDAYVQLCSSNAAYGCNVVTTASDGTYSFTDLPAGQVTMLATQNDAVPDSAQFVLAAGQSVTKDFTITEETETNTSPLETGMSVNSPIGDYSNGVPVVNWQTPSTYSAPWKIPVKIAAAPAGITTDTIKLYVITQTWSAPGGPVLRGAVAMVSVEYSPSGQAVNMSNFYAGQMYPTDSAAVRRGAVAHAVRKGRSFTFRQDAAFAPNAQGGVSLTLNGSTYNVNPVAVPPTPDGNISGIAINAAINTAPYTTPYNTYVAIANGLDSFGQPLTPAQAQTNFTNLAFAVATGPWAPFHGVDSWVVNTWTSVVNAGFNGANSVFPQNPSCDSFGCPSKGPCDSWGCPGQGSGPNPASGGGGGAGGGGSSSGSLGQTGTSNSNFWVDPSGIVQSTTGVPLSGSKVVLSRSKHRSGRYRDVPNGSTIMSPANRRNPDHTDTDGSFGWDVLPGFYRIAASHSGCTTASTKALKVPPPALDLVIVLHCARLHRARTTIKVKLLRTKGSKAVLAVATVTAHGHGAPIGVVTFTSGKKKLGSVALNPTTHAASEVAVLPAAGARVRATYSGDAAYGPSKSA